MASHFELDLPSPFDPSFYTSGQRYSANLFWSPADAISFGLEVNHDIIETVSGARGDGLRLESVARFFF